MSSFLLENSLGHYKCDMICVSIHNTKTAKCVRAFPPSSSFSIFPETKRMSHKSVQFSFTFHSFKDLVPGEYHLLRCQLSLLALSWFTLSSDLNLLIACCYHSKVPDIGKLPEESLILVHIWDKAACCIGPGAAIIWLEFVKNVYSTQDQVKEERKEREDP